jgi:hypothetical protein
MEKKSLINTLKSSTKKPNVISSPAKNQGTSSRKAVKKAAGARRATMQNFKAVS